MINIPRVRLALSRQHVEIGCSWYRLNKGAIEAGCFVTALGLDAGISQRSVSTAREKGSDQLFDLLAPVLQAVYGIDMERMLSSITLFDHDPYTWELELETARAVERVLSMYEQHNQNEAPIPVQPSQELAAV